MIKLMRMKKLELILTKILFSGDQLMPGEGNILRVCCHQQTSQLAGAGVLRGVTIFTIFTFFTFFTSRSVQFVISCNLLYGTLRGIENIHLSLNSKYNLRIKERREEKLLACGFVLLLEVLSWKSIWQKFYYILCSCACSRKTLKLILFLKSDSLMN